MDRYDVIVLGLGGVGSAALLEAARRGARTLGIEQFGPAHDRGSSHGESRLIRQAYFEHPDYVPLLRRAYEHWEARNRDAERPVFEQSGLVVFGREDGEVLRGIASASREYDVPVERIAGDARAERFPELRPRPDDVGLWEPGAGFLHVERAVESFLDAARAADAVTAFGTRVVSWDATAAGFEVRTDHGTFAAGRLVISAGAWSADVLRAPAVPLRVHRVPMFWFELAREEDAGHAAHAAAFAFDLPEGFFYGFPAMHRDGRRLVKVAPHTPGDVVDDPSRVDRSRHADELAAIRRVVAEHLPALAPDPVDHRVCLYTMSPDGHFFVDRHPRHDGVVFAAGLSGHGYKFAPVLGEILVDLALDGRTALPAGFLALGNRGHSPIS